jgi:DNA-binding protein HU-beta
VNKSQLVDELSGRFEGNRKQAQHALESVLDVITRSVVKGEKVVITGFGAFEKVEQAARNARNPLTGERVRVKKRNVPRFRAGTDLKAVVSGAKKLPRAAAATTGATARRAAAAAAGTGGGRAASTRSARGVSKATKAPAKRAAKSASSETATKRSTAKAAKAPAGRKATASKATASKATATKATATKRTAAKKATASATTAGATAKRATKKA